MPPFVQALVGAIIWAIANVVYVDLKRRGVHSFGRVLAFFAGQPTTWFSFFFVRGGTVQRVGPPADDERALLEEIRRDRQLRGPAEPIEEQPPRAGSDASAQG